MSPLISRNHFLNSTFNGIGALAFCDLLSGHASADAGSADQLGAQAPHLTRKAKHCIFLFMQGGVSQVDSFEYKPALNKHHGRLLPRIPGISGELQGRLSYQRRHRH